MGIWTKVKADDGHEFAAYQTATNQAGGPSVVLLQEIFGVTPELRALADSLQETGYAALVPALYDRIQPDCVIDYSDPDLARATKNQLRYDEIECDLRAAIQLADTGRGVALLGYCWGGGLAYWIAQKCQVAAVISFYGTNLAQYCKSPPPDAPCQFHLGVDDPMIDGRAREVIRRSCRSIDQYFEYEGAGHAFANVARPSYRQAQAQLAEQRCLSFLRTTFELCERA